MRLKGLQTGRMDSALCPFNYARLYSEGVFGLKRFSSVVVLYCIEGKMNKGE
jgi:tRNA (Thr-GGU) A37 N-methylase